MQRRTMRIVLSIAALGSALAALGGQSARARDPLPWCEYGAFTHQGPGNCSYYTFKQCLEAARGDGTCERNPSFDEYYFQRGIPAPVDVDPNGRPLGPKPRR